MDDLVSVIIPTYGGEKCLIEAVESVLSQTYSNVEIIVVDDNGIGTLNQVETSKNMERFLSLPNVKYICHEVNKNGSAARNTGFCNSSGKYIALLDDDDTYTPIRIEKQVERLKALSKDYALTYCSYEVYKDGRMVGTRLAKFDGDVLYKLLMHKFGIGSTSLMIRREVWEELSGFDESFRRHQDWEFTARVASEYKVDAYDFFGAIHNLKFRNSAKSPEIAKEFRLHYLEKMRPLIERFDKKKQKKIICYNLLDVALMWIKKRDIKRYFAECREMKAGILGITFLINRLFVHLFG